jgi:2-(1,2-epoxy-1,2-dihydrophenyl)acetyl-CoA isomerase
VVAPEALDAKAREMAEAACRHAPLPTGHVKRILADQAEGLEDVLAAEMDVQMQLFATQDHAEARSAFLEKRPAAFRGA